VNAGDLIMYTNTLCTTSSAYEYELHTNNPANCLNTPVQVIYNGDLYESGVSMALFDTGIYCQLQYYSQPGCTGLLLESDTFTVGFCDTMVTYYFPAMQTGTFYSVKCMNAFGKDKNDTYFSHKKD